jgi:hypothetical protein
MALSSKEKFQLLQAHAYRAGKVPVNFLRGFFEAVEKQAGHGIKVPNFKVVTKTDVGSTAQEVLADTGRVYGLQVASPEDAELGVIVQITDNDVVIASFPVEPGCAGEVYFCAHTDGIGIKHSTDIEVLAIQRDGSGDPAAGDKPDVVVIYGDDDENDEAS